MPRHARIVLPGTPLHIVQRGIDRQQCFFRSLDYELYLRWLEEYAKLTTCQVHAYTLMTNHLHLLVTPETRSGPGELMKRVGQRYVQYINRVRGRSGTLWEGRYRSCLVGEESYLIACYRYIELNPVRAGLVASPGEFPWSSYRVNAEGQASTLVTPHAVFLELGADPARQRAAYEALFREALDADMADRIRATANGTLALGSESFLDYVNRVLGGRAEPRKRGRPRSTPSLSKPGKPSGCRATDEKGEKRGLSPNYGT